MKKTSMMIFAAAASLGLQAQLAHAAGNAESGKAKSTPCAACHGPDGNSSTPAFPRIAGQVEDYLLVALREYKSGKRKNAIMAPQAQPLSAGDMADLAAYFASQKGLAVKR